MWTDTGNTRKVTLMSDPAKERRTPPTDKPSVTTGEKAASGAPLRGDIDSGRGRDKVTYPDPAAAPLGTDDEAAGTPITEEQLDMARAQEDRAAEMPKTDTSRVAGGEGAVSLKGADRSGHAEANPAQPPRAHTGMFSTVLTTTLLIVALVVLLFIFSPI